MLVAGFAACNKVDDLPFYQNGIAPVLSASSSVVAPVAADSSKTALTLNWTYPNHAVSDPNSIKYIIEIDSAGKNFTKSYTKIVTGALNTSFTGKELNDILLGKGYAFGVPVDMDIKVTSSYANNNERIASSIIKVKMTPYKIPPKIALPSLGRLFIVGDATDFGWSNDPTPASPPFPALRELTRISETQWQGIFNMKGSGAYKLLQKQGDWDFQFHMVTGDAAAGTFEQKNSDPGFPSPSTGAYRVTFDFQTGRYSIVKEANALLPDLYVTGDAVTPNWVNNPPDNLKFTPVTNGLFEITLALTPGKQYKFLSSFGNWQPQFGGTSATGGVFTANYGNASDPPAIPTPAEAGNYKIQVNFLTQKYMVTKI
jgi:hypothetical protein